MASEADSAALSVSFSVVFCAAFLAALINAPPSCALAGRTESMRHARRNNVFVFIIVTF